MKSEELALTRMEADVLYRLTQAPFTTQQALAEACGYSLGAVNSAVKNLKQSGLLDGKCCPTPLAEEYARSRTPKSAVLLAAGLGMRMIPINYMVPKPLVTVRGQTLIERIITQLHAVGVSEIYVVVGFLKEQFEYLVDAYGVTLIVNEDYAWKNNLHTLALAAQHLSRTYVVPCDLWFAENPFHCWEPYPWYMVSDTPSPKSTVRVNRKLELAPLAPGQQGKRMVGLSYLDESAAAFVRERLTAMDADPSQCMAFWEDSLFKSRGMTINAKVAPAAAVQEINTYEELRELDCDSVHLQSDTITLIAQVLSADPADIIDIRVLKKGMTNRSFFFTCRGKKYIMRIPGEGTDQLIDRKQEAAVYAAIGDKGISDDVVYINPESGYKITRFLADSRCCDPDDPEDLKRCMEKLRQLHALSLRVDHTFDLFGHIDYYESLRSGKPSVYRDYAKTKAAVFSLKPYLDAHACPPVLTHIDAVPDNFLFFPGSDGREEVRLIDWEYAGMQDPHVDIAMFCIYSLYRRPQVDTLIDLYFEGSCPPATRTKIYCYIAVCGLLWSNWCEYKRHMGVEFGEYSLRQYQYAKEYYNLVKDHLEEPECTL